MQIEKNFVKIRSCELCYAEPKDKETFEFITVRDIDGRTRFSIVLCERCKKAIKTLL